MLDTSVRVRFLVANVQRQDEAATFLPESQSADLPAYVCRKVDVELAWLLEGSYGFDRTRVGEAFIALAETAGIWFEERDDVAAAAAGALGGGPGVPERVIVAAARWAGAAALYTSDCRVAALDGATLFDEENGPEGPGWARIRADFFYPLSGTYAKLARARLLSGSCFVGDRFTRQFHSRDMREQGAPERSPPQAVSAELAASPHIVRLRAAFGPVREMPNCNRTTSCSRDTGDTTPDALT